MLSEEQTYRDYYHELREEDNERAWESGERVFLENHQWKRGARRGWLH